MARTRAQQSSVPAGPSDQANGLEAPPSSRQPGTAPVGEREVAHEARPESPPPPQQAARPAAPEQAGTQEDAFAAHSAAEQALLQQSPAGASNELSAGREERIRQAAYRRFESRGGAQGDPLQDWLEAEAEVDATGPGR
jgi:Protein of unknown function (DUF2934)